MVLVDFDAPRSQRHGEELLEFHRVELPVDHFINEGTDLRPLGHDTFLASWRSLCFGLRFLVIFHCTKPPLFSPPRPWGPEPLWCWAPLKWPTEIASTKECFRCRCNSARANSPDHTNRPGNTVV